MGGAQDRIRRTKERNRIYAARTRERKSKQTLELRNRCNRLEVENAELRTRVQLLLNENSLLRSSRAGSQSGAACEPCNSTGSAAERSSSQSTGTDKPSALPPAAGACSPVAVLSAGPPAARAAANTFRFTAAAAGARPPKAAPACSNLTPAQRLALVGGAAAKGSAACAPGTITPDAGCIPHAAAAAHSAEARSGCSTQPSAMCEGADRGGDAQPCVSSKASRKRSQTEGYVTLGKPLAKQSRGAFDFRAGGLLMHLHLTDQHGMTAMQRLQADALRAYSCRCHHH